MRRVLSLAAAAALVVPGLATVGLTPAAAAVKNTNAHVNGPLSTVAVTTAGDDGQVTFSGVATQVVTVTTSAGTFGANCDVLVSLRTPAGAALTTPVCGGQAVSLPARTLTANGSFKVLLDVQGTAVGTVKVAVSATGPKSLTPNAPPISVTVPAGATVDYRVPVVAASFLWLGLGAPVPPGTGCQFLGAVLSPTGATLGSTCPGSAVDRADLPAAGVATVRLTNSSGAAVTLPVTLGGGKDVAGALTPGVAKATPLGIRGQRARWTFPGTAGRRPTFAVTGSTFSGSANLALVRPDGSTAGGTSFPTGASWSELPPLDVTGTWAVVVDPFGAGTGTANLTVGLVTDQTTTITPGTAKPVGVATKGQNVRLSFTGAAGQTALVAYSGNTIGGGRLALVGPDGTERTSTFLSTGSGVADFGSTPLDVPGGWALLLDPTSDATGAITLTLTLNTGGGGTTITPGTPVTATVAAPGGSKTYTFTGAVGQRPVIAITAADWRSTTSGGGPGSGYAYLTVLRPDGSQVQSFYTSNSADFGEAEPIDVAGTWTVVVDPANDSTGSMTFTLTLPSDLTGTLALGTAKATTVSTKGQNARYTFTAATGARLTVASTSALTSALGGGSGSGDLWFYRPDGTLFTWVTNFGGIAFGELPALDATGTWSVLVDPRRDALGTLTVTVRQVVDLTGTLTPGTAKTVTLTAGQNGSYTFTGVVGQRPVLTVSAADWRSALGGSGPSSGSAYLEVLRPDGSQAGSVYTSNGATFYGDAPLIDVPGTWRIRVDPANDSTGSVTFTLTVPSDQTGTLTLGTAKTVTIGTKGQNARYTFAGTTGRVLTLAVTGSTYSSAIVSLNRPDGTRYVLASVFTGATSVTFPALDGGGTWTAEVDPLGEATGTMSLKLS